MELAWLWQALVGNLVSHLVIWGLALTGGTVLAYLRARGSRSAAPILYGLAGMAFIFVILVTATGFMTLLKQPPPTTLENVETNIRTWIDSFSQTAQKQVDPESYFVFVVTLENQAKVSVKRMKERDRYIIFETILVASPKYERMIENFSNEQKTRIIDELLLEMARLDI